MSCWRRTVGRGEVEVEELLSCAVVTDVAWSLFFNLEVRFPFWVSRVINSAAYSIHLSLTPASAANPGVLEQQRQAEFLSFKPCSDLTSQANRHLSHLTPQSSWHSIGPYERHQSPHYQHWNQHLRISPSRAPMAHQLLGSLALAGDTHRINLREEPTVRRMVQASAWGRRRRQANTSSRVTFSSNRGALYGSQGMVVIWYASTSTHR